MPSANVAKCIDAMKKNPTLVLDLNAQLTKIYAVAKVQLTVAEKVEFFKEMTKTIDLPDPYVHVHWS